MKNVNPLQWLILLLYVVQIFASPGSLHFHGHDDHHDEHDIYDSFVIVYEHDHEHEHDHEDAHSEPHDHHESCHDSCCDEHLDSSCETDHHHHVDNGGEEEKRSTVKIVIHLDTPAKPFSFENSFPNQFSLEQLPVPLHTSRFFYFDSTVLLL